MSTKIPSKLQLLRSEALLADAKRLIPGITNSMMKRPEHFAPGEFPVFLASGRGARVTDVDGSEYVDYICGLGANSLGHGHPAITAALTETLPLGLLHSLPAPIEVAATQLVVDSIPGAEMARFFKTGADATSAAVRLARAITGRSQIVTVGYNGWHDHFMYDTPGVPEAVARLTERLPLFEEHQEALVFDRVANGSANLAAVILSIPYGRVLSRGFFARLRELCSAQGVLLVLDEIVTGYRLGPGGAQAFFDVEADFVCVSKALAAGMPLSAIVGPRRHLEVMERLQVSTTFGGELLSLAASKAALTVYQTTDYYAHIAQLGTRFREGLAKAASEAGSTLITLGYDMMPLLSFAPEPPKHAEQMRRFQAEMAKRGVLLRRDLNFISGAHTKDDIDATIEAASASLQAMR